MIGWLSDKIGELQLLLDMPARMIALEHENAELTGRVMDLEKDLERVEAISEEIYVNGGELAELDQTDGRLCDWCRDNPGRLVCADPTCITNRNLGRRHA